ncbi:MAG: hypothetical protein Tsb0014_25000 [Pleurocapsa sp.]
MFFSSIYVDNLNLAVNKIKRIPKKIEREINRIPLFEAKQKTIYQASLVNYAPFLPKINAEDQTIVNCIKNTGIYVFSIEKLQLHRTKAMLKESIKPTKILQKTKVKNDLHGCAVGLTKTQLIKYPDIFLWGLEPRLLNIIENYIGLPVIYQGLSMRRDLPDGKQVGVRKWHLDWEDRSMIKVIIYLNDVDINGGPYEYIPRDITAQAIKKLRYYNFDFLSDKTMEQAVPESEWKVCIGKAGTMIITDTANVLHRAKPPVNQERFSITFFYTSNQPYADWKSPEIAPEEWNKINKHIDSYQRKFLVQK